MSEVGLIASQAELDTLLSGHMPEHTAERDEIHRFLQDDIGMSGLVPADRLAVLPPDETLGWLGGQYYPGLGGGYALDQPGDRASDAIARMAGIAHEFGHAGTLDGDLSLDQHVYFKEALAGMAEQQLLDRLHSTGEMQIPRHIGAITLVGADLYVPAHIRRIDAVDDTTPIQDGMRVDVSQGLLAADSMSKGLEAIGLTPADVLQGDGPSTERFDMMKDAVEAIAPGMADRVETFPNNNMGAIHVAAHVKKRSMLNDI